MSPNTEYYLSSVNYVSENKEIIVNFVNGGDRFAKRYSFFPKMHFPLSMISKTELFESLSLIDSKKFKLDFKDNSVEIIAANFDYLKQARNLFLSLFSVDLAVVEPERQFLIEKGWNYFDSFSFSEGTLHRSENISLPKVVLDSFLDSLPSTVADLLLHDRDRAADLVKGVCDSKLLKIPIINNPSLFPHDFFLENIFFESGLPIYNSPSFWPSISLPIKKIPNISLHENNCSCCVQSELHSLFPSSLVRVRFLREAFYFTSDSKNWAVQFHLSFPFRGERIRRKKEYGFGVIPSGPFFRGEEKVILLRDALSLMENGEVEFLDVVRPVWLCSKKETVLSREFNNLSKIISKSGEAMSRKSRAMVASKGLFFSPFLESDSGFFYFKSLSQNASSLYNSAFSALMDRRSRFFLPHLSFSMDLLE